MSYQNKFLGYLEFEKNFSPNTIISYKTDLQQFTDFLNKDITETTHEDIENFIKSLRKQGNTTSTTNRKLSSIKSFYKYLFKEKIIEYNPADLVESGKIDRKLPNYTTIEDFKTLIDTVDNLRDKLLINLLFASGARRVEIVSLKKTDIDFNSNLIKLKGKGSKERVVPVHENIIKDLKVRCDAISSKWVFPSKINKGNHITPRQVNQIITKWIKAANLEDKNLTPHSFRHAFGKYMYENGGDIKSIKDMMGHESINTTDIYTKISTKRNIEEYKKYHPLYKKETK